MHLNKIFIVVPFILLAAIGFAFNKKEPPTAPIAKGFAVVELFTSEGCSSCPSADAVLTELKNENRENVFILGFHIDYWDRLGWKDRFSNSDYSKRQQQYTSVIKGSSVYTPQAIVNGSNQLVGSDKQLLYGFINAALKNTQGPSVTVTATHNEDNKIRISYTISNNNEQLNRDVLNIALVQNEAVTEVKNGENSGRKLHHINIVRTFKTIQLNKPVAETILNLPAELSYKNCTVIAYTQHIKDMTITGATQCSIN